MHERSLAAALIQQIDEELQRRGLHALRQVRLQIGEFAGIEPLLLESAFLELAESHWKTPVELRWEAIPLTARCRECSQEFAVRQFRFVCPLCAQGNVEIIAGEELTLVSLRAEPHFKPIEVSP